MENILGVFVIAIMVIVFAIKEIFFKKKKQEDFSDSLPLSEISNQRHYRKKDFGNYLQVYTKNP